MAAGNAAAVRCKVDAAPDTCDLSAAQGQQAESIAISTAHADCKLVPRPALGAAVSVTPLLDITVDSTDDSPGK